MSSNTLIVNLNKVSYAKLYYRNRSDNHHLIKYPSDTIVNGGILIDPDDYALPYLHNYPGESRLERARRMDIIDIWIPVLKLSLSNNHTLTFEHDKALKLWKAWMAYITKRKK